MEDGVPADPVRSAGRAAALAHRALLDDQGLPARIVQSHRARVLHLEAGHVPLPDHRQGPGVDLRHVRPGILVGPVQARLETPLQGGRPHRTAPYAGLREGHGHGVGEPVLPGIKGVPDQFPHELRHGGVAEVGAGWIVDMVTATVAWGKPPLESRHSRHLSHPGTDMTVRVLQQGCHEPLSLPRGRRPRRQAARCGRARTGRPWQGLRPAARRTGAEDAAPLTCSTGGCSTDGKPTPGPNPASGCSGMGTGMSRPNRKLTLPSKRPPTTGSPGPATRFDAGRVPLPPRPMPRTAGRPPATGGRPNSLLGLS